MENFIKQLDSLSENDPFALVDRNFFSENHLELIEKHRLKLAEDRRRIRDERRTKTFDEIMNELVKELSHRPMFISNRSEGEPIELDTSDDEQDDLEHSTALIDPSQSIGHSIEVDPLKSSTYVLFPSSRPLKNYAESARRNTYTLDENSSSSSSIEQKQQRPNYVRLESEGFDPQQTHHGFDDVKDARSTFSIPKGNSRRITEQQARRILREKLPAFIKGHLTRQLFRTEHVKGLIRTLHDTRKVAVQFQNESLQKKTKLDTQDFQIIDQLIDQAAAVLNEIQAIFFQYSASRRILMILRNEQTQALRLARNQQRILKDTTHEVIQRPMIDPAVVPSTNQLATARPTEKSQSDYRRTKAVLRRHVTSVSSTANTHTTRPLKKTISVQRQSRPSTSNNVASTNPPRSSSANTVIRPPLRLAPASPLFRNRLK